MKVRWRFLVSFWNNTTPTNKTYFPSTIKSIPRITIRSVQDRASELAQVKMKRLQSLLLACLCLTSVDAFANPSFCRKRNEVSNGIALEPSPRTCTQIHLQGFGIKETSTNPPQESTAQSLPSNKHESEIADKDSSPTETQAEDNAYVRFAKKYPFWNNFIIAALKTCAADVMAQTVIGHTPFNEIDLQRSLLFCAFGGLYSGAFQYLYQVQVFKKLFDVDKFTSQSWGEKLRDIPGIKALAAQTGLDLTVLTLVYLPTFYIFKASVFSGSLDPSDWFSIGVDTYVTNFGKDETDLLKVWLPADLICFSVPLYLRMPVRQSVSFLWTVYLSFARGGR